MTGALAGGDRAGARNRARPSRTGSIAWLAVALGLGLVAVVGTRIAAGSIDWQPGLALAEPWRLLSAAGVHYSAHHLGWNLAGLALTGWLGWVAAPPVRNAGAWLAAWPATQLGLLVEPQLLHYGGLSGVLHAGVAVVAVFLLLRGSPAQRRVGAAIALGLAAKVVSETPWGPPLRHPAAWDIPIAPLAHATGALAGAVCCVVAVAFPATRRHA